MVVCCLPEDLSGADLAVRVARRSSGRVVLVVLVVLVLWLAVRSSGLCWPGRGRLGCRETVCLPPGCRPGLLGCPGVWLGGASGASGSSVVLME